MTERRTATMKDVARASGVSQTTVSLHLNARIQLPPETARHIDEAIAALDYRPNARARSLAKGSSQTLGFVTTDIAYPFFAAIASAAEAEAALAGFSLVIFNSRNETARELAFLSKIEDGQIDGALFMTNHVDDGSLRAKIDKCRKVVLLDEDVAGTCVPKIFVENEAGARLATEHLLAQGHRRIAFVSGPQGMTSSCERLRGFNAAMRAAGVPPRPGFVQFGTYDEASGMAAFAVLRAIEPRPTAILATADSLAIGIIRAARAAGVAVPRDLSIVGFDDMLHMDLLDPPLTAVRQSIAELGRRGVRALVALLAGTVPAETVSRVPVELMIRGSVAPPAGARAGGRVRVA